MRFGELSEPWYGHILNVAEAEKQEGGGQNESLGRWAKTYSLCFGTWILL